MAHYDNYFYTNQLYYECPRCDGYGETLDDILYHDLCWLCDGYGDILPCEYFDYLVGWH